MARNSEGIKDKPHCDVFGNPLAVGDFVIYAAALGRSSILKVAIILELREVKKWNDRVAYKVSTRTAERSSVYKPGNRPWDGTYEWKLQKDGKKIVLEFTERMVRVDPATLPKQVRKLLKKGSDAKD